MGSNLPPSKLSSPYNMDFIEVEMVVLCSGNRKDCSQAHLSGNFRMLRGVRKLQKTILNWYLRIALALCLVNRYSGPLVRGIWFHACRSRQYGDWFD